MIVNENKTLPERVHERILRQSLPMLSDHDVSFVVKFCPEVNPFSYEVFATKIKERHPELDMYDVRRFFRWIAYRALRSDNTVCFVTSAFAYFFNDDISEYEDEVLLDNISFLRDKVLETLEEQVIS